MLYSYTTFSRFLEIPDRNIMHIIEILMIPILSLLYFVKIFRKKASTIIFSASSFHLKKVIKDEKSKYYVDREDLRDNEKRFPHGDIYGNKVHTTVNLLAVKYGLEGFLELLSGNGWFFNCTEAGIFGITKKFEILINMLYQHVLDKKFI